jgi:hypothetical protein
MRKGEEPKTPRHASAAATRNNRLPHSRHKHPNKYLNKYFNNNINYLNKLNSNTIKLIAII